MKRSEILDKANAVITGDRQRDYGDPRDNFTTIAHLWEEVFTSQSVTITPEQVALCMALVKVARLISSPDHLDSWVDISGYAALGGEIGTEKP